MDKGGARYCQLCALSEMNVETPVPKGEGKAAGFSTSFSVKKDAKTGQVLGWDDFFQYID